MSDSVAYPCCGGLVDAGHVDGCSIPSVVRNWYELRHGLLESEVERLRDKLQDVEARFNSLEPRYGELIIINTQQLARLNEALMREKMNDAKIEALEKALAKEAATGAPGEKTPIGRAAELHNWVAGKNKDAQGERPAAKANAGEVIALTRKQVVEACQHMRVRQRLDSTIMECSTCHVEMAFNPKTGSYEERK